MGSALAPILANLFMGYHENDSVEKAQVQNLHSIKNMPTIFLRTQTSELDA